MFSDQALQLVHEARLSRSTGSLRPYLDDLVRAVISETNQLHAQLVPLAAAAREQQERAAADPDAPPTDPALAAKLVTYHLAVYRNKRCLLVYHNQRIEWLTSRVWSKAGAISLVLDQDADTGIRASIRPLLAPAEVEWLRSYTGLISMYKDTYLDVLDVTLPLSLKTAPAPNDGRIVVNAPPPQKRDEAREALGGAPLHLAGAGAPAISVYAAQTPANAIHPPNDIMISVVATRDARNVETERGTMHLHAGEHLRVRRDEVDALLLRGWLKAID
ncbi:DNA replication protein psf1 [Malassezia cuniculi]|uniref:DNA replication complex GINS protein PSF1 n=1 Tax=Malassezia cuniculi TaxID=948313 RepID=A0AAF0EVK1_9BASI|nr:DNA replication protein psf1 [Malassezia cuniculi]